MTSIPHLASCKLKGCVAKTDYLTTSQFLRHNLLGRPGGFAQWQDKLRKMQDAGYSQGQMQRETGLSYNTRPLAD
jgi:hypothetical protein